MSTLLLERQDAILAELKAIRGLLERDARQNLNAVPVLTRTDRDHLGRLLPAVAGLYGSAPWTVTELLEHRSVRLVTRGRSAAHLGRLLRRGRGIRIGRLVVEQVGEELGRQLWKVAEVIDPR